MLSFLHKRGKNLLIITVYHQFSFADIGEPTIYGCRLNPLNYAYSLFTPEKPERNFSYMLYELCPVFELATGTR